MDAKHTPHERSNERHTDADHKPHGRRYTVSEAAEVMGISAEAVRARINRGTLHKEKDTDGTVYVRMNGVHTHPNDRPNGHMNGSTYGDHTAAHTVPSDSVAFQIMQNQIAFLQAELERKDAILLTMAQRIPELEASTEPRESRVGKEEEKRKTRRSWWARVFLRPEGEET
jgi:hypothetical protein